jgi:hypothetical protein
VVTQSLLKFFHLHFLQVGLKVMPQELPHLHTPQALRRTELLEFLHETLRGAKHPHAVGREHKVGFSHPPTAGIEHKRVAQVRAAGAVSLWVGVPVNLPLGYLHAALHDVGPVFAPALAPAHELGGSVGSIGVKEHEPAYLVRHGALLGNVANFFRWYADVSFLRNTASHP